MIGRIKELRRTRDLRKQDLTPSVLDFGPVRIHVARHFGFCYGVENAIEISYRAIDENPDKRVFLLSQMIHNPQVNQDLQDRGITFIMDTDGKQFMPWEDLKSDDVVIIPAFGTTLAIEQRLSAIGVDIQRYNTTCPFVEKVWNRSQKLGQENHTVIIHGKPKHEETRATFSHSSAAAPSIVVEDMEESKVLGEFIAGSRPLSEFESAFAGRMSPGFDPQKDLQRVGVVNQTTMLASDTQAIADHFKQVMTARYGADRLPEHFADTRDTLCYATNDNQDATHSLMKVPAHMAIVVGGYNSSNTSHLVELCEQRFPTYFIHSESEMLSKSEIRHFDLHHKKTIVTSSWIPDAAPLEVALTSGASCPDALVDRVIETFTGYFPEARTMADAVDLFEQRYS